MDPEHRQKPCCQMADREVEVELSVAGCRSPERVRDREKELQREKAPPKFNFRLLMLISGFFVENDS